MFQELFETSSKDTIKPIILNECTAEKGFFWRMIDSPEIMGFPILLKEICTQTEHWLKNMIKYYFHRFCIDCLKNKNFINHFAINNNRNLFCI
jgi:hypothetical protein